MFSLLHISPLEGAIGLGHAFSQYLFALHLVCQPRQGCCFLAVDSGACGGLVALFHNLLSQCQVVLTTSRLGIVKNNGQAVTWTFAQFHVALYHRFEHQLLEMSLYLIVDLVGQAQAAVVHREQETLNFQLRIQLALDDFDGVEQLADTF